MAAAPFGRKLENFLLIPRMLLRHTAAHGPAGRAEFAERFEKFMKGQWIELLTEAHEARATQRGPEGSSRDKYDIACAKVRLGEVSQARQVRIFSGLAPGTAATLEELQRADLRPPDITDPIPAEIMSLRPSVQFQLDRHALTTALRSSKRGAAPDLAGMRTEHLRVLLEDEIV